MSLNTIGNTDLRDLQEKSTVSSPGTTSLCIFDNDTGIFKILISNFDTYLSSVFPKLVNGVIPEEYFPFTQEKEVVTISDYSQLPATGDITKRYVTQNSVVINEITYPSKHSYIWDGTGYADITANNLILGETSTTAYRGDRGKIAYDFANGITISTITELDDIKGNYCIRVSGSLTYSFSTGIKTILCGLCSTIFGDSADSYVQSLFCLNGYIFIRYFNGDTSTWGQWYSVDKSSAITASSLGLSSFVGYTPLTLPISSLQAIQNSSLQSQIDSITTNAGTLTKETVAYATLGPLPSYSQAGSILVMNDYGTLYIGEQVPATNSLVLIKNEFTNTYLNGIYRYTVPGTATTKAQLEFVSSPELVYVTQSSQRGIFWRTYYDSDDSVIYTPQEGNGILNLELSNADQETDYSIFVNFEGTPAHGAKNIQVVLYLDGEEISNAGIVKPIISSNGRISSITLKFDDAINTLTGYIKVIKI